MLLPLPPNPPPPPFPDDDEDVLLLLSPEAAAAVPRGPAPEGPDLPAPAADEPPFETVDDAWLCDPFAILAESLQTPTDPVFNEDKSSVSVSLSLFLSNRILVRSISLKETPQTKP
jgi:hypothetical protein